MSVYVAAANASSCVHEHLITTTTEVPTKAGLMTNNDKGWGDVGHQPTDP
jgi:hypothetical protein